MEKENTSLSSVPQDAPKSQKITLQRYTDILNEIMDQPPWRSDADKAADYFDGNQYDSDTLSALAEIGMSPQIENLVAPTVKSIIGLEAKIRKDWKVIAQNNGKFEDVSEALSQKLYEAEKETYADRANSEAFKGAVVSGIAWIGIGRNSDPFKYPYRYEFIHRDEVYYDMKALRPDYSDGQWLLRSKWYDLETVQSAFPEHKDLLHLSCGNWNDLQIYLDSDKGDALQRSFEEQRDYPLEGYEWYISNRKRLRVNELWYRVYVSGKVIKLPNGIVEEYDESNESHFQAALIGSPVVKANYTKIRVAFFVGMHKLLDMGSPYRHGEIPYVKMVAYEEDKTRVPYGEVRNMIPMQDEINARNTKMMWLLAAKRIFMTEGAAKDDLELVRQEAGRPDAIHILDPEAMREGGIFKVESDFALNSQQYQSLVDKREALKNTAGVYAAFEGASNQQSGVALHAATEQSSQTLATLYDNFEFAKARAGNMLLSMIIDDIGMAEQEVVVESDYKPTKTVVLNKQGTDGKLTNAVNQARMKVALSDVPSSSSYKQQTLQYMTTMTQGLPPQYQAVMIKFMMRLTDLASIDKQEIIEAIAKINGEEIQREPKNEQEAMQIQQAREQAMKVAQMQMRDAELTLAEKEAKVQKLQAEAKSLMEKGTDKEKEQLKAKVEEYEQDLIDAKEEFDTKRLEIQERANTALQVARINAQTAITIANMQNKDKMEIQMLNNELDQIEKVLNLDSQSSDTDKTTPA